MRKWDPTQFGVCEPTARHWAIVCWMLLGYAAVVLAEWLSH